MSLKRFFSHHSHGGHHRSRPSPHTDSSEEFHRSFPDDHSARHPEDVEEHEDVVVPYLPNDAAAFTPEQETYRSRRRSSVQILDKKFIQSLSNQFSSSVTTDAKVNATENTSENVCEC